jgi:glycerol kinase
MAIDQGTTSSKAFLVNRRGEIVGQSGFEFKQIYPKPGWVEHDPLEIWESQKAACLDVMRKTGTAPSEIAAIGITNQRETTVVWDRNSGKPVMNAIVWQCRRTSSFCEELRKEGLEGDIRNRTGLVVDAYFSATKLHWILENTPGALRRAEGGDLCFGTIDSWLVYKLTGGRLHITDVSNASRAMLFNINTLAWDAEIRSRLGIPDLVLPAVRDSSECYGETAAELFEGVSIPIAGIAGDQQSALFGQRCFQRYSIKNTYGTGCFLLINTGEQPVFSKNGLLTSIGWRLGGKITYVLEGSVFNAGAAVQWLRDELGLIKQSEEIEALARRVPDNGGVYFLPAFVGLGAPHWDMYTRGMIAGITRGSNAGHIARATIESMAFQTKEVLDCIQRDCGSTIEELRVDGGAAKNNLLMQFQADLLRIPVVRPREIQTTALGAAFLAGLATGFWKDPEEIRQLSGDTERFAPAISEKESRERWDAWEKLVSIAKQWGKIRF